MANEAVKARVARLVDPVARMAGYKPVGKADWVTRFPRAWRRDRGHGVVHEISLDAGTWRSCYYLQYAVYVRPLRHCGMGRTLVPAIHDVADHLLNTSEAESLRQALTKKSDAVAGEGAGLVRQVIEERIVPLLETLATIRDVVECFRTDSLSAALQHHLARPALGLPPLRYPSHCFDLPVISDPERRVDESILEQGSVSLLVIWRVGSREYERGHKGIIRLNEQTGLPVIGIAIGEDQSPEVLTKFLENNDNPFNVCAYDLTGCQLTRPRLRIWQDDDLPIIHVVDGEGLVVYRHYGAQITQWEFEQAIPAAIAEAEKFYDWPVPEWQHTGERGRKFVPG